MTKMFKSARNSLNGTVHICCKVIGVNQRNLAYFCDQQIVRKASRILSVSEKVLPGKFVLFNLGKCYVMPVYRSNRLLKLI